MFKCSIIKFISGNNLQGNLQWLLKENLKITTLLIAWMHLQSFIVEAAMRPQLFSLAARSWVLSSESGWRISIWNSLPVPFSFPLCVILVVVFILLLFFPLCVINLCTSSMKRVKNVSTVGSITFIYFPVPHLILLLALMSTLTEAQMLIFLFK